MIREYRPEDLPTVMDVWESAFVEAHPFLDQAFIDEERRVIPSLYMPRAETWVFETEGRIVGFISLLGHEVGGLFVAPAYQRRGIGRRLIEHARQRRGELVLEVFEQNTHARAFYEAEGFVLENQSTHEETGLLHFKYRLPAGSS